MNRLWLAPCAAMLALGGCMHASKSDFMRHYTLGDTAHVGVSQSEQAPARAKVLFLAPIDVPPWLEGTRMLYRLDYLHDARVSAYAHSDWIAPPATLLETLVRHAIVAGHGWLAVTGAGDAVRADASLHIRLDDFRQDFAQPGQSRAVIDATVTLVDNAHGTVLGQKAFRVQVAAAGADAEGGALALGQASRRFAGELEHWLQGTAAASGH